MLVPETELPGLLADPALPRRLAYPLTLTIDGVQHPLPDAVLHVPRGELEPTPDARADAQGLVPVPVKPDTENVATVALPEQA